MSNERPPSDFHTRRSNAPTPSFDGEFNKMSDMATKMAKRQLKQMWPLILGGVVASVAVGGAFIYFVIWAIKNA